MHLPPALFRKLFVGRSTLPLVSVVKEDSNDEPELMWAVEDETAPLNPKVSLSIEVNALTAIRSALFNHLMQRIIFPF